MIPRVAVVAEGPTDWIVMQAILDSTGLDYEFVAVQPEVTAIGGDYGDLGGGWRGVLGWCENVGRRGGLAGEALLENSEFLIIHIDADVSDHVPFDCRQPKGNGTRPHQATVEGVTEVLRQHLGAGSSEVLFCIPHNETEAWLLPIFKPDVVEPEDVNSPAAEFVGGEPKLCRFQDGKLKKIRSRYEDIREQTSRAWSEALSCTEAKWFTENLTQALRSAQS